MEDKAGHTRNECVLAWTPSPSEFGDINILSSSYIYFKIRLLKVSTVQ
jgi:hypothetical protein